MSGKLLTPHVDTLKSLHESSDIFKNAVLHGLSQPNKSLPSKFFYDAIGTKIFNQITQHPDYYLTQCELEVLNYCKPFFINLLRNQKFNLIELGPGEGIKSFLLIDYFMKMGLTFSYLPIDISAEYLQKIITFFNYTLPTLELSAVHSDYFSALNHLEINHKRNLVLFLGSSIGNFSFEETQEFLKQLHDTLNVGDYVLIGFDLRKDVTQLLRAYNDSDGLTTQFNLNLLERINRELGGNFKLNHFRHYPCYNVFTGAMESYLISLLDHSIYIEVLNKSFDFYKSEPIHTEFSYKYHLKDINDFARAAHCKVIENFFDDKKYFANSLWEVK